MKAKEESMSTLIAKLVVNLVMHITGIVISFTISWKVGVLYIVTVGPILSEIRTLKSGLLT